MVYHGVDEVGSTALNTRFIGQKMLERHLQYFKEHFHVVNLDDYFAGNWADDRLTLAITFDDGYRNNLTHALPLLEKYQLPATFYITGIRALAQDILWPDFLDIASQRTQVPLTIDGVTYEKRRGEYRAPNGQSLKSIAQHRDTQFKMDLMAAFPTEARFESVESLRIYWEQLSIPEIQQLCRSPYASIGSHGWFHNDKGSQPYPLACEALQHSKHWLESITHQPIVSIAYPHAGYTPEVVQFAKSIGFTQQLAVDFLYPSDPQEPTLRERFGYNPFISFENQMACLLEGRY